ncbi:unnamed protein product [Blepharisma stoltei]|uniref:LNR domain-containing protein n=1 Tax=Blepharisma stoltei TaxID=1481888 RepID=A0AAU9IH75_9CILI|nr:unnamed protein product [Blepharisma stoltei]
MNYLIVFFTLLVAKGKDLECHLSVCPDIRKGNHKCDPGCMISYCNFDTMLSIDGKINKENSDCYEICANFDGCSPEKLGNGICDDSCNTENCGFDWGDCTCAPGCLDSMLGDGNCDEACNNWDCDLDNHDCGLCADGCFPIMLGNGACNPECNNEGCLYDYKDCQCAENCLWTDYGSCKPECMVASCNYGNMTQYPDNQCQNTSLAIFSSYQQIIRNNFSYIVHLEDCYEASNHECTLEKAFNFENCYQECHILECNYANGNCDYAWYSPWCKGVFPDSEDFWCISCIRKWFDTPYTKTWMNGKCALAPSVHIIPSLFPDDTFAVVPFIDTSSAKIPHIYFVCPIANSSPDSGDGSYYSPFRSFSFATNRISHKYSIVYLLECDGYNLTIPYNGFSADFLVFYDAYTFDGKSVKFTPLNNSKITLRRNLDDRDSNNNDPFGFLFIKPLRIEISNIIFDWSNTVSTCNNERYCDYCPYVTYNLELNIKYSDQGEIIDDFLPSDWCKRDEALNFIELRNGNLILKNVSFVNFRNGFKTILYITTDSNVTFSDVTFDNIKVSDNYNSWVIWWDGASKGNFKFENGVVSRLNNGYELNDPINTKGFMNATNINSIVLRNVEFRNNAIFKNYVDGVRVASLFFINPFQVLWVESCNFIYNYCDLGIFNIKQQLDNWPMEIDDSGIFIHSKQNHIHIFNSNFSSNYGITAGVLYVLYEFEGQNVVIENCSFTLNGIESGALIHIESNYADESYLIDRKVSVSMSDGSIIEGDYLAKRVKLSNLNFTKNYSGENGVIEILKMVNIEWVNIRIESNGLILSEAMNVNSILLKYYIDNPQMYAKHNISNPNDLNCQSLSMVSNSIHFSIEKVNIINNVCMYSSPSIIVSNTTKSAIRSASFYDNKGAGSYGICLAFLGDILYEIMNSEFYTNINYQSGSPGAISCLSSLSIKNCTFSDNIGTLYFGGQNLSIFSSNFDSNISPSSNGGAISLSIAQDNIYNSMLFISNTTFANNSCSFSGGAIYIDRTIYLNLLLALNIEDTNFYHNKAIDGSCIYIDNTVALTLDSSIKNCSFWANEASFSGTISASYIYGILIFDTCNFVRNTGVYSSGFNIAIGENKEENPSKLFLNSCIFQFNSGNRTISMDDGNINSTLEVNDCLLEYNIGSIFTLDNDYAVVENSKIQHNYSPNSGGALSLKNLGIFISKDTTFLNCSSDLNGGVASISLKSQFFCFSCFFSYNYANFSGGVIYADSDARFYIDDSIISQNSCKDKGSAIFMASSLANSSISNTEIFENHAYSDGTMFILSSSLSIFSSKVYKNKADEKNPGLYIDDSIAIITDTHFYQQSGNEGCFIYMGTSYVQITGSAFYEGFSNNSGIAIHATSSSVEISSSAFSNLFSNNTGGTIYLYEDSTLSIDNSEFLNSGSSIDSYSSSILIESTLFKNHSNTAIYANQIEVLQILSSEFLDNYGSNGGAVYCTQCHIIAVISSNFASNYGRNGGAIYVTNLSDHPETSQLIIASSNFNSNAASNGGAVWTNNINLIVSSSIFIENRAELFQSKNLKEISDGLGGAIKISCQGSNVICNFNFLSNSFINNSATHNGGAINWDDSKPTIENNIFENNKASYGPDIASFPIMMIFLSNNSRNLERKVASEDSKLTLNNIASGQNNNPPLAFILVDDLNQIVTTDTTSQAQINAANGGTIISGTTMVYAKNGIYYFDDYIISAEPGSSVYIDIVSSGIDTRKMNTSRESLRMSSSFSINVNLRLCEVGEATVGLICEICPKFYYNIDVRVSKCLDCPSSAICYGNFTMVPKSGYWRDNEFTDKFWKCPYPPACLGSPNISDLALTGVCKKGYENNMCHSCENGYSRLYTDECQVCPDTVSNVFRWIGISAFLIFTLVFILKTTRDSWYKQKSFSAVYLKIFWNYLQIMLILATYNLNWPYEVIELFYIQTSIDYIGAQLFSFDCFLQLSNSKSKIYYLKILITSLTPFVMAFLCMAIWILIYKIKKERIKEIKDDYISTCIVLLFLIHPSIIDTMFSAFSCREINSGELWLNADLGIRCWDDNHLFYGFILALPTIIIWVIAVPLLAFLNLIKNKKHLEEIWMKKRYSFLCDGYNSKHYYWEFLILYYKVILISCSVFLSNISTNIQALTAALFFVLFLYLHTRNEPFSEAFFNKTETFSRLASLISILIGLCFLTNDLGAAANYFLVAVFIIANALFIFYILINFLLQFAITNRFMTIIKRIFNSKEEKYIISIVPCDKSGQSQSYEDEKNHTGKLASTMVYSGHTKIENIKMIREDLGSSNEIDPFASEQSISAFN